MFLCELISPTWTPDSETKERASQETRGFGLPGQLSCFPLDPRSRGNKKKHPGVPLTYLPGGGGGGSTSCKMLLLDQKKEEPSVRAKGTGGPEKKKNLSGVALISVGISGGSGRKRAVKGESTPPTQAQLSQRVQRERNFESSEV